MSEFEEIEHFLRSAKPTALKSDFLTKLTDEMEGVFENADYSDIEAQLLELEPFGLSCKQFSNIEEGVDNIALEEELYGIQPAGLSSALLAQLTAAMESSEVMETEESVPVKRPSSSIFQRWNKVAAIVAILLVSVYAGVSIAGKNIKSEGVLITDITTIQDDVMEPIETFLPVSEAASSNIVNASHEGVIMRDKVPHDILKIDYEEVVESVGENGELFEVKRPMVKVILIPKKTL